MTQAGITPAATVRLLCNRAEPYLSDSDKIFFEPGCGDGNILDEVLARRLEQIPHNLPAIEAQNQVLWVVAHLYGVDIRPSAVVATRQRLQLITMDFIKQRSLPDYRFLPLLEQILEHNFVVTDLLAERSKVAFPIWQRTHDFEFTFTPAFLVGGRTHE